MAGNNFIVARMQADWLGCWAGGAVRLPAACCTAVAVCTHAHNSNPTTHPHTDEISQIPEFLMIFISIRGVPAAFWEETPLSGVPALLRSDIVALGVKIFIFEILISHWSRLWFLLAVNPCDRAVNSFPKWYDTWKSAQKWGYQSQISILVIFFIKT